MTYGKLVRWGNGVKVVMSGDSQEELGQITAHHWVIKKKKLPIFIDDRFSPRELREDFEILQKPQL